MAANADTQGWFLKYDVKGQCGRCEGTVQEGRMVACAQGRRAFPNASNCPVFRQKKDDDE